MSPEHSEPLLGDPEPGRLVIFRERVLSHALSLTDVRLVFFDVVVSHGCTIMNMR